MNKHKETAAMKKLEKELKEEKQAELKRRREVTLERKKIAEEKQRLEEAKALVRQHHVILSLAFRLKILFYRWVLERRLECAEKRVVQRK